MEIINVTQGSEEWYQARKGFIGASSFGKVLAGGQGKTRTAYMYQVAAERITDEPVETYSNAAMEWGTLTEPQARAMYELDNAIRVEQVGFIKLDDWVGCSPDGLVGESGLIEIKCPNTTTQIETYLNGEVPTIHTPQIQGQLYVTKREWVDFVSFDPRIKNGSAGYFTKRVYRDDEYIKNILCPGLDRFIIDLQALLEKLK